MLKCNVVMTKDPVCCLPTDAVSTAAQLMKKENVGSIPVVQSEQSKIVVGIVTDRDLALQVVANQCDSKTTTVADVMSREVISCLADDDLQKALEAMSTNQLRRLPIVDKDNRIVGIIAQADVATRIDDPKETALVVKKISQPHIEAEEPLLPTA